MNAVSKQIDEKQIAEIIVATSTTANNITVLRISCNNQNDSQSSHNRQQHAQFQPITGFKFVPQRSSFNPANNFTGLIQKQRHQQCQNSSCQKLPEILSLTVRKQCHQE